MHDTSESSDGADSSGRMMVARSVVRSPRSVNCPCSSLACRPPETLTWRSARTSTCSLVAWARKSMLRPELLPSALGGSQRTKPEPVSSPPSRGAVVRLPL
ncbi:hypothetical protein GY15_26460 [Delftia sp. 670]|nr:hypothetical protein GY15_26460 [Delftia sp. 670]